MGGCKSKDETANSIRRVKSSEGQRLISSQSRLIEVNYQKIPNKFRRSQKTLVKQNSQIEICGLIGLQNLGNTCFINSAIQCLSNTQPLTDYFMSFVHQKEINLENPLSSKGQITEVFAKMIRALWLKKQELEFISTISNWGPQFAMGTQEDAQEFFAFLLDMIHEDLNRVKKKPYVEEKDYLQSVTQEQADESWKGYLLRNRSIIVDLFQGQQRSSLKCLTCGQESHRFEPYMYLSVPVFEENNVKNILLEDCIKEYCKQEKLVNEEGWFCPNCKMRRDSVKQIDLWTVPNILVIHLKRFKFTRERRCKLRTLIDFPINGLNFENLVLGKQVGRPTYDLYAVINHEGTLGRGHYTTMAKNRDDMNWYLFNDSIIKQIDPDKKIVTSDAYLLLYYKNSVEEFARQSLTQDQWQNLENIVKKNEPKIMFQKPTLKNMLTNKSKQQQQQIQTPRSKSESQNNISFYEESILENSYAADEKGHRKSKKFKPTIVRIQKSQQGYESVNKQRKSLLPPLSSENQYVTFNFQEDIVENLYEQQKQVKLNILKSQKHRHSKRHLLKISQMEQNPSYNSRGSEQYDEDDQV